MRKLLALPIAFMIAAITIAIIAVMPVVATPPSAGVSDTLQQSETKSYTLAEKAYEITLDFVGQSSAKFTVNKEVTSTLLVDDTYTLVDGAIIQLTKISWHDLTAQVNTADFSLVVPKGGSCGNYGDVDGNGFVAESDVNLLNSYLVGNVQLAEWQKKRAEVNGDNKLDIGDSLLIAQYVAGVKSTFPVCSTNSGGGGGGVIVVPTPTPTPVPPEPGLPVVFAKLDERFTLQEGQKATVTDYKGMSIKLSDIETKFCAAVVGQECPGPEATVVVSVSEPVFRTQGQEQTEQAAVAVGGGGGAAVTASSASSAASASGSKRELRPSPSEPVMPIVGKLMKLSEGESETVFDATITALKVSSVKATFVVTKKLYASDIVDIGIAPRAVNVNQGETARYTITVQDKHTVPVCPPGAACLPGVRAYEYKIQVIGLPFETTYEKNFVVEAGTKKDFVLSVDTSRTLGQPLPPPGPQPAQEVDTAVAGAGKATVTTGVSLPVAGRASAPSADVVRKCLNTGDNYEMCVVKEGKSVSATTTATIAATAVAKAKASEPSLGIPEKPVPRLSTYGFAVRVVGQQEGAVDVAYATLNIVPKEPTEPPTVPGRLPPCGSYGDVDQDGYVSMKDANLISNYTVGNIQLTESQKKNAEVTADGIVDIGDALLIAQYANGLRSTFTVCDTSEIIVVPPPIEVQPVEKVSISLERGWNLVSLPGKVVTFLPSDCTKSRKLLGFIYIQNDDGTGGKYVSLQEARRQLGSGFSEYLSKHAFWVYSYNGCTFQANVKPYTGFGELSLQPGWNLIPIAQDMVGRNLNELNVNCDFTRLFTWDSGQQSWNRLTQDYMFSQTDVNSGFVAKTENYCELGGELTISPPDLPD